MTLRKIQEIRRARPATDGDGVAIQRLSGMRHAGMDPVLLIDELRSDERADFAGGFPPHPHRGMQTLTYMKVGGIRHEDNQGNHGEIRGGGAQYMSAGSGIIHSEMPTADSGEFHGFQLWVNLPAAQKMSAPRYRDIPAEALTRLDGERWQATAIAGEWQLDGSALQGPLTELEDLAGVLDVQLQTDAAIGIASHPEENLLAYIYDGALRQDGRDVEASHLLITGPGEILQLSAGPQGANVLILRGNPLREPVANNGPFVMNSPEEIEQAIRDYQSGAL